VKGGTIPTHAAPMDYRVVRASLVRDAEALYTLSGMRPQEEEAWS